MTLLALLACACPTFEELPVVDPDAVASTFEVGLVEQAIADFAAWTGRAGVCVDRVELVEEIDWAGGDVAGGYRPGAPGRINVEPHGLFTREITLHELCHALDEDEVLSETNPDLFPPGEPDPVLYPTEETQRSETFAQACQSGPTEHGFDRAFEAACGVPIVGEQGWFLADEVWAAQADVPVAVDAFTAVEGDEAFELLLPPHTWAAAARGDAEGLLLLTTTTVVVGHFPVSSYATLSRVTPSGEVVASWRLPDSAGVSLPGLYGPEDGRVALSTRVGDELVAWSFDEASGRFTELALEPPADTRGAVAGGVFWYVSGTPGEAITLRGADLRTGEPVEGPALTETTLTILDATPGGDALLVYGLFDLGLLDVATGAFTVIERPGTWLTAAGWVDDARFLFDVTSETTEPGAYLHGYTIYDRDADVWSLSADPCGDAPGRAVALPGGAWTVESETTDTLQQRLTFRPLALELP